MILFDTNVVSEMLREVPNAAVLAWLDRQNADSLCLSAISVAEILFGIDLLPEGKRKRALAINASEQILTLFQDRILPFDKAAAYKYADIVDNARRCGLAIAQADGQIAAVAAAYGFAVATRDTSPFLAASLTVINPWTA
jgi:predicted nucleic acid-binding protein